MCFVRATLLLFVFLVMGGCGDNLIPSGEDKRPPVVIGTTGPAVGQKAPVFSLQDTNGNVVTLASALTAKKGVVLYFTMWCSICEVHMNALQNSIPRYPSMGFYLVDYVSGSVADARSAEIADGFFGTGFTTLADTSHLLLNGFQGTMGTTVVIDSTGTIRMNEDYKDGSRFQSVLTALP